MTPGTIYKHRNGLTAGIKVLRVFYTGRLYKLKVQWYVLGRNFRSLAIKQNLKLTDEQVSNWEVYRE